MALINPNQSMNLIIILTSEINANRDYFVTLFQIRCIMSNAKGQMISMPLTVELPLIETVVSNLIPSMIE